jgi:rRNA maturation protein Rpf1
MSESVDDAEWLQRVNEAGSEQIQIVGEWDDDAEQLTLYDVERPRSTTHWLTVETTEMVVATEAMR